MAALETKIGSRLANKENWKPWTARAELVQLKASTKTEELGAKTVEEADKMIKKLEQEVAGLEEVIKEGIQEIEEMLDK